MVFVLFPDRRDQPGPGGSTAIADLEEKLAQQCRTGPAPMVGGHWLLLTTLEPHEALALMATVGWHHPVHVVYRTSGEDRWSYATVTGRTQGEEN